MRTFKFRLRHSLSKSQVHPRPEHNTKILIKGRFADGDVEPSEPHSAGGQQAGSPFLCRASLSWLLTSGAHHLQPICSLWSKGFAILFLCFQVWADYSFTMRQSLREDPSLHLIAFFTLLSRDELVFANQSSSEKSVPSALFEKNLLSRKEV